MKHLIPLTLVLTAAAGVAGCLSAVPTVPMQRFGIVPNINPEPRDQAAGVLAVRPLEYVKPYTTSMVYRPDEYTIAYRDSEVWAEAPRDSVTRALQDSLAESGYFRDVGNPSDIPLPNYILTGELRRFDEMRTTSPPAAVCEVRIEVRQNQRPAKLYLARTYTKSVSMKDASADALAEAMTAAVSQVVADATQDIIAAIKEGGE